MAAIALLGASCGSGGVSSVAAPTSAETTSSVAPTTSSTTKAVTTTSTSVATTTAPVDTTAVPVDTTEAPPQERVLTIDEVGTVRVLESGDLDLSGAACSPNATIVAGTPQGWTVSVAEDDPQAIDHRVGRATYTDATGAEVVVDFPSPLADPRLGGPISDDLGRGLVTAVVDEGDRIAIRPMWTATPDPNVTPCAIGYWSTSLTETELIDFVDSISIEAEA